METGAGVALRWLRPKLLRARIVKHTSGPLHARGTDVALEEMILAYERLELEQTCSTVPRSQAHICLACHRLLQSAA